MLFPLLKSIFAVVTYSYHPFSLELIGIYIQLF